MRGGNLQNIYQLTGFCFLGDDVLWVFAGESVGKILLGRSQGEIGQSCFGNSA